MEYVLTASNDDGEWATLVETSSQGSVFSSYEYLKALNAPLTRYFIRTPSGVVVAGTVVMESLDSSKMHAAPFPFTPYQGILFSPSICSLPEHKRITTEFRITEFAITSLVEKYGNFSMALSPMFEDIRPFLWHNYHQSKLPQFSIRNRYTGILDLSGFQIDNYLKSIRAVRRQEFNKSKAQVSETDNISLFIDTYLKTFERQDISVSDFQVSLIRNICASALKFGYGRLSMATTDAGVASMALFLYDNRYAYYLFGANDPLHRHSGASTRLMIDNIQEMAQRGKTKLDFVGVNSPNRGDFKISFGPKLEAYYEVSLNEVGCEYKANGEVV